MGNTLLLYAALRTLPQLGKGAYRGKDGPCAVGHLDDVLHAIAGTRPCIKRDDDIRTCVSSTYGISVDDVESLESVNDNAAEGSDRQGKISARLRHWIAYSRTGSQTDIQQQVDEIVQQLEKSRQKKGKQGVLVT